MKANEYLKKNRKGCFRHDRNERMYYEKDVIKLMENYAKQLSIHFVVRQSEQLCVRCGETKEEPKDEMCVNCWQKYKNAY